MSDELREAIEGVRAYFAGDTSAGRDVSKVCDAAERCAQAEAAVRPTEETVERLASRISELEAYKSELEEDHYRVVEICSEALREDLHPESTSEAVTHLSDALDDTRTELVLAISTERRRCSRIVLQEVVKNACHVVRAIYGDGPTWSQIEEDLDLNTGNPLDEIVDKHNVGNMTRRISELEAQLAEARRDAERLDWLSNYEGNMLVQRYVLEMCMNQPRILGPAASTIREAIDAAIAAERDSE